jgi:hypothetical protein
LDHCLTRHLARLIKIGAKIAQENTMRRLFRISSLIAAAAAFTAQASGQVDPTRNAFVPSSDPLGENVNSVVYLEQNWSPEESVKFYFTTQGSQLIPYNWFLALEQVNSTVPFRDNANLLAYRYLAQNPGPMNPDGLPVGFVAGQGVSYRWLGLTCAACHTTEIRLGSTAYRVDGAPTHADVQAFLTGLICAAQQTQSDPAKFGRFAATVLGTANTPANQADLKAHLATWIQIRIGYNLRNFPDYDPKQSIPPPPSRYGRLDAVDAIVNEVYWHAVKAPDPTQPTVVARPADAPVSYPCLWDTPQHDRVEWLGIAKSGGPLDVFSLARNTGEVLGVFANFNIPDDPTLLSLGYSSSVKFPELEALENQLKTLWSPLWPDDFPKIDQDAARQGASIYQGKCLQCHALIDRKSPHRKVNALLLPSGTDPRASENFFHTLRPSGKLNGVNVNFIPFTAKIPPQADPSTMLSNVVLGVLLGRFKEAPPDGFGQVDFHGARPAPFALEANLGAKYKARPLNGIWATAPYLHNGSVPNLDALLRPAAQRPKSFSIGVRTFDPVKVGYLTDVPGFPRFEVFNPDGTAVIGNSNAGHEYGADLDDQQRAQLLEYLKSL